MVLLVLASAIGAELDTCDLAASKVAQAVQCEVQDSASVSFAGAPPAPWQYLSSHYSDISVQTAGNQVRSAKGMKVSLDIRDVKLSNTNNSQGTIGITERHHHLVRRWHQAVDPGRPPGAGQVCQRRRHHQPR